MKNKQIIQEAEKEINKLLIKINYSLNIYSEFTGDEKIREVICDGIIKRFENLFLRVSKFLALRLTFEGIDTFTPREAIKEAVRVGWVKDPDFWLLALDARSSSVSAINDLSMNELLNLISKFSTEIDVILNLLKEIEN